ncbi:MAG: CPBP family intramembrane metalloprotease, partial [Oscillospiraceae bacterium]|nr:CPBP family intramembrane metalloprotease [Oscillospiraceae bacterium]
FTGYWYNILLNAICVLCVTTAAFLLICGKVQLPAKSKSFAPWELAAYLFGGVFLACLAGYLAKLLPTHETASSAPQGADLAFYAVYTLILAPIAEEIAFRGAALSRLRNSFGAYSAALISATLFAAYHMSLAQFPYTFVLGFCLAIVAQRSGSIIPCIILHALNNLLTLSAALSDTVAAITDIALPILGMAGITVLIITKRYKLNSKTD